ANPLTAHYGLTHGLAIAIMLPHVIDFNMPVVGELYGDLVQEAGFANGTPDAAAHLLQGRIRALMRLADLPATLTACGISGGILPVLAEEASRQWTARFNPRPVTERDILGLYESAL